MRNRWDLNLIRSDGLRTAIIEYAGAVQMASELTAAIDQFRLRALAEIHQRVDAKDPYPLTQGESS